MSGTSNARPCYKWGVCGDWGTDSPLVAGSGVARSAHGLQVAAESAVSISAICALDADAESWSSCDWNKRRNMFHPTGTGST